MKKNKLLVAVTTTKIYEYLTTQPTADLAFDEYVNQSDLKLKVVDVSNENAEIQEFIEAKSVKTKRRTNKNSQA